MKVYEQLAGLGVLAFALGALAFLFAPASSLSPAIAQQTTTETTTTTTIPEIPEPRESPQPLMIDDEPFYQAISGNITNVEILEASPSVVVQKESFVEKALIRNIGNVTNTGTFVETIHHNGTHQAIGKGIITTENGDIISWNAYDLGVNVDGSGDDTGDLNTERRPTFRGIMFLSTASEDLSFMDNVVGLYINDENGRRIWEWRNS
ncbi:MAG TPA: hypothetical protein VHF65_04025 [Nitrososphaera sp.]|nr:hypothetical protein [Nitrososphaera sp.]